MLVWLTVLTVAAGVDVATSHLCIQEPRQRLEANVDPAELDLYSDCYYKQAPCGKKYDQAPPHPTLIKSGSNFTVKLHMPLTHIKEGKKGSIHFKLKAAYSDKFEEIMRIPDKKGKDYEVPITFPNVKGNYILQVVHEPYGYYNFYSCSDIVFVDNIGPALESSNLSDKGAKDGSAQHCSCAVASILVTILASIVLMT